MLVRRARLAAGLTQVELAKRAGTSQAAISAVERGVADISVDKAVRLLRATGCHLVVLGPEGRFMVEYEGGVDPHDLQLMQVNLTMTPLARFESFCNLMRLKGLARR